MVYADLSSDESDEDEDEGDESGDLWPNKVIDHECARYVVMFFFFLALPAT